MIRRLLTAVALSGAVAFGAAGPASAADDAKKADTGASSQADTGAVQPDNSRVNKQDRGKGALTADQQKENSADRKITQQIRRAIVKDKSLSTYAHNVKVITVNGHVTLKGPVRSAEEKSKVEAIATQAAAGGKVDNQLSIAHKKDKKQEKQEKKEKKDLEKQQKELEKQQKENK